MSSETAEALITQCRENGLRVTRSLRAVVELLCSTDKPLSVHSCPEHSEILATCDTVTLYRLFERLESIGLVRRIGLHERAAHYVLTDSLRHRHFICCQKCGEVLPLEEVCTLGKLDESVTAKTGFTQIYHELIFYGMCEKCA